MRHLRKNLTLARSTCARSSLLHTAYHIQEHHQALQRSLCQEPHTCWASLVHQGLVLGYQRWCLCSLGVCRPYGYPPPGIQPLGMYPPGYMRPGMPVPLYPPQRPGQPSMSMPAMRPPPGMTMQYPGQPGASMPPQAGQPSASAPGQPFPVVPVGQKLPLPLQMECLTIQARPCKNGLLTIHIGSVFCLFASAIS